MRPLVLISGLRTGGAERVTVALLKRLVAHGVPVAACTVTARHDGPLAKELEEADVRRLDLGARRLADPRALRRLIALLRREAIDVVHAHGQDAAILAAAARVAVPVPLVITRHVMEEPASTWREAARARVALRAFRRADASVAVSAAAAGRLARLAGIGRSRIRVIVNGIELRDFAGLDRSAARSALAAELGLGAEAPLALVPAVLRAGKGHEVLLDALPALRRAVPDVRLLFAGAGEREPELRRLAIGHAEHVRFLGERVDVPRLLAACDIVVLPSFSEALPTVLMEAAAAGRAVVATRVGGTPEVVAAGSTGLLVPPGDSAALGQAAARLLRNPPLRETMGAAATRRATAQFGLDRQLRETVDLWLEMTERSRQCA